MKSIRKIDAIPKLNGSWKFLDDYSYEGMIYGQLLYSTCHHGIIKKITFPDGYDLSEFTIVSVKDIPGENIVPEPECDQPFMVEDQVFHFGQVIMGIAHPNRDFLRKFIKDIKVEYKKFPALIDIKECLDNEENAFGKELTIDHRTYKIPDPNWIHHQRVFYTNVFSTHLTRNRHTLNLKE
jgi:xanthine dehydrogenase molybdopterin-binding subunit B